MQSKRPLGPPEVAEDEIAGGIGPALHKLFQAPLPLDQPSPVPTLYRRVEFLPHFLERQAGLLVLLPRRLLALSSAVGGVLADRTAPELRTLLPAMGAAGLDRQRLDRQRQNFSHLQMVVVLWCDQDVTLQNS